MTSRGVTWRGVAWYGVAWHMVWHEPIEGLQAPHRVHSRRDILERDRVSVTEENNTKAAENIVDDQQ